MRGWLFDLTAAVALVGLLATAGLWVRSHRVADEVFARAEGVSGGGAARWFWQASWPICVARNPEPPPPTGKGRR